MEKIRTLDEAISLIKDGDCVGVNSFLALANPVQLHEGIAKRFRETGSPKNLTVFCSAGFGDWEPDSPCESHIAAGAVSKIVLGHMGSMPATAKKILSGELEAYNLPLGVMSHMIRAAAAGKPFYVTKIGVNLFVDPKYNGYRLNERSKEEWVSELLVGGERYLSYQTPQLDIALIKGTSCDPSGNISFEKECATIDALALAQAVKRRGGKVIVQVERTITSHLRPRNVIIPGILVDAVVVCPQQAQLVSVAGYEPTFSGDEYIQPCDFGAWAAEHEANGANGNLARTLVGRRAYRELKRGDIANIGIGIPESVALLAAKEGLLRDITLTVESGAMGGLPAFGRSFGATVGADTIYDMAQQFDFYDGGGLDVCFIGALEIDERGNVNGHYSPKKLAGIGGFANITQSTRKVVFCATFTSSGLETSKSENGVKIVREGRYRKFVNRVASVSFSAENALATGQEILYVTERCVFRLHKEGGLLLDEVSPGVDIRRDILDLLPFDVRIARHLIS